MLALQRLLELGFVDGVLALGDDDGGNAVADQVGEGARFRHETIDAEDQSNGGNRDGACGAERGGKTASVELKSGDAFIFGGPSRLAYHGVDRIYPDTSTLLRDGGRINLTMRRVTKPK